VEIRVSDQRPQAAVPPPAAIETIAAQVTKAITGEMCIGMAVVEVAMKTGPMKATAVKTAAAVAAAAMCLRRDRL
jgi:hypothetical protein